jgi:ferredoxin
VMRPVVGLVRLGRVCWQPCHHFPRNGNVRRYQRAQTSGQVSRVERRFNDILERTDNKVIGVTSECGDKRCSAAAAPIRPGLRRSLERRKQKREKNGGEDRVFAQTIRLEWVLQTSPPINNPGEGLRDKEISVLPK